MAITEICEIHSQSEGTSLVAMSMHFQPIFAPLLFSRKHRQRAEFDCEWTEMSPTTCTSLKWRKILPLFHEYGQRTRLSAANRFSMKILR